MHKFFSARPCPYLAGFGVLSGVAWKHSQLWNSEAYYKTKMGVGINQPIFLMLWFKHARVIMAEISRQPEDCDAGFFMMT